MKPISLSEDQKNQLIEKFTEKIKQDLDSYCFNGPSSTLSIKMNFEEVAKEKIQIIYTQEAYLRMQMLVEFFDTEVAWYGLSERLDEKTFRVYDVKICKQYVTGAKVDTEPEDTLEFYCNLSDEEHEHLHFQAHSHVKMSTGASGVDLQMQEDVVKNLGGEGYYIFQIWNKNGDINTYLYDLDNNMFYDRKDVTVMIEDSLGTMDDFLANAAMLVTEKKYYPYTYGVPKTQSPTQIAAYEKKTEPSNASAKANEEKEDDKQYQPTYLPGYYGNYGSGYSHVEDW